MKTAVIFGAGGTGKAIYPEVAKEYQVLCYIDNDYQNRGGMYGLPVKNPATVLEMGEFDDVILASVPGYDSLLSMCERYGIGSKRIVDRYVRFPLESRRTFLKNFSMLAKERNFPGAVAEAGVFEGDFAKYINEYFPERLLYLFDTFSGFDEQDIQVEREKQTSAAKTGDYGTATVEQVMGKLPHAEKVVVCKGYFPDSAVGIEAKFCFVNLDLDLYIPTRRGLDYFQTHMVSGGIILVHDYFADTFRGPKKAVDEFLLINRQYSCYPIGDGLSCLIAGF